MSESATAYDWELFDGPDVTLSDEFYAPLRQEPEETRRVKALMHAVLQEAIRDYQRVGRYAGRCVKSSSRRNRLSCEAEEWFLDPTPHLFSFNSVCSYLGYSPSATRARILRSEVGVLPRSSPVVHKGKVGESRRRERKRSRWIP